MRYRFFGMFGSHIGMAHVSVIYGFFELIGAGFNMDFCTALGDDGGG